MSWDGNCRTLISYMRDRPNHLPAPDEPVVATMPTWLFAHLMGVSEEEALMWLEKHAQPQDKGLWLITAPQKESGSET